MHIIIEAIDLSSLVLQAHINILYHFELFGGHSHKNQCPNGKKLFATIKFGLAGIIFHVTVGRVPYLYMVYVTAVWQKC